MEYDKTVYRKIQAQGGFYDDALISLVWIGLPFGLYPFEEEDIVPTWNEWDLENLKVSVTIATEFLSHDGFFVTTSGIDHQFEIVSPMMGKFKLEYAHSMFLETTTQCKRIFCGKVEEVSTVVITFFSHPNCTRELIWELALLKFMKGSFNNKSDTFVELPTWKLNLTLDEEGNALHGATERHINFCGFLVFLCSQEG
ncbi:hypothetical protein GOP47_0014714 [Adiantum capillus-veneris]|uniref:Uncharacterized protein n=1 Tax=Adiantum capillus-veneris TaxID=13818 RepID=A0A9D4UM40_ADICA|nr:hypothetical protein GOP47_0014714 [Adiantum capillus-veneris]